MSYYKVSIVILKSAGAIDSISPVKPMVNKTKKPIENNIGVSNVIAPRHMVVTQLNTFTPVGTAISMVAYMKKSSPATAYRRCTCGVPTMKDGKAIAAVA